MWIIKPTARIPVAISAYQLAPRNDAMVLYASAERITTKFIKLWNIKNRTRNKPEILIISFRPIEDLISQLIKFLFKILFSNYIDFQLPWSRNEKFTLIGMWKFNWEHKNSILKHQKRINLGIIFLALLFRNILFSGLWARNIQYLFYDTFRKYIN